MYMDNGMLAFLMMLLLGIDALPNFDDIEYQYANYSQAIMRED